MKNIFLSVAVMALIIYIEGDVSALDPPHYNTDLVDACGQCHTLHQSPGSSLTSEATNENLCLSCHKVTGMASAKPFTAAESSNAIPGTSGRQHSWDGAMPASSSPSNTYGLRAVSDLSSDDLKVRLAGFNNKVVCSICHNQHSQGLKAWDPLSSPVYTALVTTDRHFMRMDDDLNQLCEDCHYYRVQTHTYVEGPGDGVKVFSHPVAQGLNANSKDYDKTAPLDANGVAQSGGRFAVGAAGEGNDTNNLVFDSGSRIRCLTCHRIHYADSNRTSVDAP